ncbi:MAG TPA: hypothetical protein VIT45_15635 [Allosphingosinicella sp.]
MPKWARRLVALSAVALLAASPASLDAQRPDQPKVVLQALPMSGVDAAAWSLDDKYLVSASGFGREVQIWDVGGGVMLDRIPLPAAPDAAGGELMRILSITAEPDGRTFTLTGAVTNISQGLAPKGRAYALDMRTRTVRLLPDPAAPEGDNGFEMIGRWVQALEVIYDEGEAMSRAEAEALLPRLPDSHDGRLKLRRHALGFDIVARGGGIARLHAPTVTAYDDAALAPDGRRLALLGASVSKDSQGYFTRLDIFDTLTARYGTAVRLAGDYEAVRWLSDTQLLATSTTALDDRESTDPDAQGAPPPELVVDATTGQVLATLDPHCFVTPLPGGGFIGAGLANCRPDAGSDRALARYDSAAGRWRDLSGFRLAKGNYVGLLAVSPTGDSLAVSSSPPGKAITVSILDPADGTVRRTREFPQGGQMTHLAFTPDGKSLLVAGNGRFGLWRLETGDWADSPLIVTVPTMFASDGRTALISGHGEDVISRFDLATGAALEPLAFGGAGTGGYLANGRIFWAASALNGLRMWDTKDWSVLLSTNFFDGKSFLTVTPHGRYDTNLGADSSHFRWLMADAPFQSLAPQTFMRDYFEPRLAQRLIDCTSAGTCASAFKPLPPVAALNRVLPKVRVSGVRQGATAASAIVSVEVEDGLDSSAANGKTRSGVFDVRLFRNGRLVLRHPDQVQEDLRERMEAFEEAKKSPGGPAAFMRQNPDFNERRPEHVAEATRRDLETWRRLSRIGRGAAGKYPVLEFEVELPTGSATEVSNFTAYAFNEDRVKSDTARFEYRRPPVSAKPPRAFVVTIGIDDYDSDRLDLRFAASDATLLGDRLASIPGYEVRRIALEGVKAADGKVRRVTREAIEILLSAMGGADVGASAQYLAERGFDASQLDRVRPDDIVIISFSGHGWADRQGNFYLVPADGKWPAGAAAPDVATLLSSANLSVYLNAIQAAEIALIVDACHSAASVDGGDFKPGPMGDAGLGQLAFDKGIRILAATQADDVALEDPVLRQGLLTYALAGEGITATGGKADMDSDGRIGLDEWLVYASRRLPSLSEDVRLGRFTGAAGQRGFVLLDDAPARRPKVQEPSLFDFTGEPSKVVLRGPAR